METLVPFQVGVSNGELGAQPVDLDLKRLNLLRGRVALQLAGVADGRSVNHAATFCRCLASARQRFPSSAASR
jgi:hypothetical protein